MARSLLRLPGSRTAGAEMTGAEAHKVVIVKPGARHQWQVSVDGQNGVMSFTARHLAIDFGRAYAKLRRATMLHVFNEKGVLEREEKLDSSAEQAEKSK